MPSPSGVTRNDRLAQLARAWDEAASGYDAYFVPRFAGWVERAASALDHPLPDGQIVVPCCGTGPELVRLAQRHPRRPIVGIDLSPGMVDRARARVANHGNVRVEIGDASDVTSWGGCAAVLSCFGLQQMPEPALALEGWARALAPGGVLSVAYWPEIIEPEGPFAWLREALAPMLPPSVPWEAELGAALGKAGCVVVSDELVRFEMSHESASAFLDAVLDSGPGRSLVSRGEEFVRQLRHGFMRRANEGRVRHCPHARQLVARAGRDSGTNRDVRAT